MILSNLNLSNVDKIMITYLDKKNKNKHYKNTYYNKIIILNSNNLKNKKLNRRFNDKFITIKHLFLIKRNFIIIT